MNNTKNFNPSPESSKVALLFGVNKISGNKKNNIYGSINNVIVMRKYLIEKREYMSENIRVLTYENDVKGSELSDSVIEIINLIVPNNLNEVFIYYSGPYISNLLNDKNDENRENKLLSNNAIKMQLHKGNNPIKMQLHKGNNPIKILSVVDSPISSNNYNLPCAYSYEKRKIKILLDEEPGDYESLEVYSLNACKNNQKTKEIKKAYKSINNGEYSITKNRYGGAFTSGLIKILNKDNYKNTQNFTDILSVIRKYLKTKYKFHTPVLSSSKKLFEAKPIKQKLPIKQVLPVKIYLKSSVGKLDKSEHWINF